MKLEFYRQTFLKNILVSKFLKILSVTADSLHKDGRTFGQRGSYDEANNRFSKFSDHA